MNYLRMAISFSIKKWQCVKHTKVAGKELTLDKTNIYRNVYNPVLGYFLFFQTNRLNNQQKDYSVFYHENIRNLWVEINGKRYPEVSLDLDWNNKKYGTDYEVFQDFKRVFIKIVSLPYVDKIEFKNKYPIYSFDLSDQPHNISGTNVILYFMSTLTSLFQRHVELMK